MKHGKVFFCVKEASTVNGSQPFINLLISGGKGDFNHGCAANQSIRIGGGHFNSRDETAYGC